MCEVVPVLYVAFAKATTDHICVCLQLLIQVSVSINFHKNVWFWGSISYGMYTLCLGVYSCMLCWNYNQQ